MRFISVQTISDALSALARHGDGATVLAGGTDVMIQLGRKELETEALIHIEALNELKTIQSLNDRVEIGALTTHRSIAMMAFPLALYKSLRSAAASVGSWQTQSVGTIGGNICNASPAADMLPPLLVHDAQLRLRSEARGERTISINDFLLGRRHTARKSDELLTHITIDAVPKRSADVYLKVGRRGAMEVAIVGLALRLTMDEESELISDLRIATCATGPISCRATEAEAVLRGQRWSQERISEAGEVLCREISPIDDVRGSAAYRLMVLPRLLQHAMSQCLEKIQSPP